MSRSQLRYYKRILLNETGQMSIFVALIFQVLFVFFAMVINIGLLVHDKINLQNAVDLGAYYAAQRQAEILTEISHLNYQIRQDNKLLAWRYRVIGGLGRQASQEGFEQNLPPARKANGSVLTDKPWVHPAYQPDEPPHVCVANDLWEEIRKKSTQLENYCYKALGEGRVKIPDVQVIASFVPGVSSSASFAKIAQQAQIATQEDAGPLNWAFTMQMIYAYKLGVGTRKQLIWKLRRNLISQDFRDQNDEPVRTGVMQTVKKNLTVANASSFDEGFFQMFNGFAHPSCAQQDGEFLLPEVRTAPALMYMAYDIPNSGAAQLMPHTDISMLDPARVKLWDPTGVMQQIANGEPEDKSSPIHSSLGFEKNPWCMGYIGVRAKTRPHKPFAPFGSPIELEARGYAQPFGGRVGPWYRERWSRGAAFSASGDRVDPRTSPRLMPGGGLDSANGLDRLPSYSRYPGDPFGAQSEITMGAQRHIFSQYGGQKPKALSLRYWGNFDGIPTNGDVLAQEGAGGAANPIVEEVRKAEISAVAPDLFDATYYSIDPNFTGNYKVLGMKRFSGIPPLLGAQIRVPPDIGGRNGDGDLDKLNVEKQITTAITGGGLDQQMLGKLYYPLRDWQHLLTGWASSSAQNFAFPDQRYAKCDTVASENVMIPGKCAAGGRTGYSVRIISRSHLMFPGWKVGGDGEAPGEILNTPDPDF